MVALNTPDITLVPLEDLAGVVRNVPVDSQIIHSAESIGICLGRPLPWEGNKSLLV
jgi:hypothetical protein